jgi:osmotically-inducible protein OsmY
MSPLRAAACVAACCAALSASAQTTYTYVLPAATALSTMSDDDMEYTVAKALADDDSLKGTKLTLRVIDHRIVLEGFVRDEALARQARAVAENAVPPELVVSKVEVRR